MHGGVVRLGAPEPMPCAMSRPTIPARMPTTCAMPSAPATQGSTRARPWWRGSVHTTPRDTGDSAWETDSLVIVGDQTTLSASTTAGSAPHAGYCSTGSVRSPPPPENPARPWPARRQLQRSPNRPGQPPGACRARRHGAQGHRKAARRWRVQNSQGTQHTGAVRHCSNERARQRQRGIARGGKPRSQAESWGYSHLLHRLPPRSTHVMHRLRAQAA